MHKRRIYIPINLQQTVSTSTQSIRRDNAPTDGTCLQIIRLENTTAPDSGNLNIVGDFSIYQSFLGKSFTTDLSVSTNYDLAYNITLKRNGLSDTNVIRLMPGYFSGELTAYGANDIALSSVNDVNIVEWKYSNKIELHFSDGYYPMGSSSNITAPGAKDLKWYAEAVFDKREAASMTDGHKNTELLQAIGVPWEEYTATYTCYRGTNEHNQGVATRDILWYLPSVSELTGIWISSLSTQKQLAGSYWSSIADPNADKTFVAMNEGKVCSDAAGNTHAIRTSQGFDKAVHVGDVDK